MYVISKSLVPVTSSWLNIVLAVKVSEIKILVYEINESDTFSLLVCLKYHSKLQSYPTKRRRYFYFNNCNISPLQFLLSAVLGHISQVRTWSTRLVLCTSVLKKVENKKNKRNVWSAANWEGWKVWKRDAGKRPSAGRDAHTRLYVKKDSLPRTWKPASKTCQWRDDIFRADKRQKRKSFIFVKHIKSSYFAFALMLKCYCCGAWGSM